MAGQKARGPARPGPAGPLGAGRGPAAGAESVPDAPAELRGWCEDLAARLEAMHLLMEGQQVTLAVHDDTAHYTFAAVPNPFHPPLRAPGITREAVS